MNKKLYVGNLSYNVEKNDIEQLFAAQGEVKSVNLIVDQYTGKIKGFGFIEMATFESANRAQENLNGTDFMGRTLKVNMAEERDNRRTNRNRF